jgi:hypothetical protein
MPRNDMLRAPKPIVCSRKPICNLRAIAGGLRTNRKVAYTIVEVRFERRSAIVSRRAVLHSREAPRISSIFSGASPCKSLSAMRPCFMSSANTIGSTEYR